MEWVVMASTWGVRALRTVHLRLAPLIPAHMAPLGLLLAIEESRRIALCLVLYL